MMNETCYEQPCNKCPRYLDDCDGEIENLSHEEEDE